MSKKIILLAIFTGAALLISGLFVMSILKLKEEAVLQQKKSLTSLGIKQKEVEKTENDSDSGLVKNQKEEQNQETDVDQINTNDWQTYRNEEYGFEVKYPKNWYWENYTEEFAYYRKRHNLQKQLFVGFYPNDKQRGWEYLGEIQINSSKKTETEKKENLKDRYERLNNKQLIVSDKLEIKKSRNGFEIIIEYDTDSFLNSDFITIDCGVYLIRIESPLGLARDVLIQMANNILCF